jgi:hypothetical protein
MHFKQFYVAGSAQALVPNSRELHQQALGSRA